MASRMVKLSDSELIVSNNRLIVVVCLVGVGSFLTGLISSHLSKPKIDYLITEFQDTNRATFMDAYRLGAESGLRDKARMDSARYFNKIYGKQYKRVKQQKTQN